jgi:hypothetical protein
VDLIEIKTATEPRKEKKHFPKQGCFFQKQNEVKDKCNQRWENSNQPDDMSFNLYMDSYNQEKGRHSVVSFVMREQK